MAFTHYEILGTFVDEPSPRWAARLRFGGDETIEAVLRFGTSEPAALEIDAVAQAWIDDANRTKAQRDNKLNGQDIEDRLWAHWRNVRREIIRYCTANPTCTGAQVVTHLGAVFAASPFDWPNLFALMQNLLDIPSFPAMRDYIVAHTDSIMDVG